jgi:apoptosis-inducing factor 3
MGNARPRGNEGIAAVCAQELAAGGPDLSRGVSVDSLAEGQSLVGHVGDDAVLLARSSGCFFAVGAACTHYGAPLAEGLVLEGTIRCPWHHARFSLATGEAACAPALDPIASWEVEQRDGEVFVGARRTGGDGATAAHALPASDGSPSSIVIVGAGAAGNAAAEMLRRSGFDGALTMIGAEDVLPYDRPNLSKDYLAGDAPEECLPLRSREFYDRHAIRILSGVRVTDIDAGARHVTLRNGRREPFDRLLLATGAVPVRLRISGSMRQHVYYLRSLVDCRAIIDAAAGARHAVVVGASFIGLEVTAALRKRGVAVEVVGLEQHPLERVLGSELGSMIQSLHEAHGVVFHLRNTITEIGHDTVTLAGGRTLPADIVVIGIGVRPKLALAESAGLAIDRGVLVDEYLETSIPGIFAAGDIARWPDRHSGDHIRVEHWVVAERQGQVAARNMLACEGGPSRQPFDAVPFFWSRHYDTTIHYVGHAERWDAIIVEGDLAARDATVTFQAGWKTLAVATVGRDRAGLQAEASMEDGVSRRGVSKGRLAIGMGMVH